MVRAEASAVRAVYDAFNARDIDGIASHATPDARAVNLAFDATAPFRDDWENWATAFPDGAIEVNNIVTEDDHVVAEIVGRGTHTGTLAGPQGAIPPTGQRVEARMVQIFRFHAGKIVEMRTYLDAFSLFRQLGLGAPQASADAREGTGAPKPRD